MGSNENPQDDNFSLLKTILLAIFVGAGIGVFDIWMFEPSLRMFFAGMLAGITYALIVFLSFHIIASQPIKIRL
jgi:hypothetical protein